MKPLCTTKAPAGWLGLSDQVLAPIGRTGPMHSPADSRGALWHAAYSPMCCIGGDTT